MKTITRIACRGGAASALALLLAVPAQAQTAQSTAPSGSGFLEEVLVTARKREERAQDTPVSLTVATGEMLQNRSITQFVDLRQQTPMLHMVTSTQSPSSLNLAMRGQVLVDVRLNVDPTIGIYMDGVYLPRAQGVNAADLLDIDRVEVLAGPQGTLYGKNTTGGTVSIFTKMPTDKLEGLVKARYGRYGENNISAVLNLPASPDFAVRLAVSHTGRDGYGKDLFDGTNPPGELNSNSYRATAHWTPTDRLAVTLRGDYATSDVTRPAWKAFEFLVPVVAPTATTNGGPNGTLEAAMRLNGIGTTAAWLALPVATRASMLAAADTLLRTYSQGDPDDSNANVASMEKAKIWGYSATIDFDLTDTISAKSITAYRAFRRRGTGDLDGTPIAIHEYLIMQTKDRQISEELQIAGNFLDGRLSSLAGFYWSDEEGVEGLQQRTTAIIAGANPITFQDADVGSSSWGVFTQHTLKITDQISATGGIRYTKDKRELTARNRNATFCTSLGVTLASIGGLANCSRSMDVSFDAVSYTAGLEYRPTETMLFYVKRNRGYRAGGLQQAAAGTVPAIADAANDPFRPEFVEDIEVGAKTEWFDRRLRANIALFHTDLSDAIRNVSATVPGVTGNVSRAQNAATADVDGVEFDVAVHPVPGLELSANGAWYYGRFARYITPTGEDRTELPLLFTPKWKYGASASYTADLSWGSWRNQVDYSWTGRQLASEPAGFSKPFGLLNFRSSVTVDSFDLDLAFYAKNITNKQVAQYPIDSRASLGFIYAGTYNPPASYGVELIKRF